MVMAHSLARGPARCHPGAFFTGAQLRGPIHGATLEGQPPANQASSQTCHLAAHIYSWVVALEMD